MATKFETSAEHCWHWSILACSLFEGIPILLRHHHTERALGLVALEVFAGHVVQEVVAGLHVDLKLAAGALLLLRAASWRLSTETLQKLSLLIYRIHSHNERTFYPVFPSLLGVCSIHERIYWHEKNQWEEAVTGRQASKVKLQLSMLGVRSHHERIHNNSKCSM